MGKLPALTTSRATEHTSTLQTWGGGRERRGIEEQREVEGQGLSFSSPLHVSIFPDGGGSSWNAS